MTSVLRVSLPPANAVLKVTLPEATYSLPVTGIGIPGPPGPPGPGAAPVTYDLVSATSWYQAHTHSYLPQVRLVDSLGRSVFVEVDYPDATHVAISFPTPFTGKVLLT